MPFAKNVHINLQRKLDRRTVLRGSGIALAMPWLNAMQPAFASKQDVVPAKRFVSMTLGLGLLPENLFPETEGSAYAPSRYLKRFKMSVSTLRWFPVSRIQVFRAVTVRKLVC